MEVFAPIPSAIEMMASAAKPGCFEELAKAVTDILQQLFHRQVRGAVGLPKLYGPRLQG